MGKSKRRKRKNGKPVGNGAAKNLDLSNSRRERFADQESGVTLQDLINVLAMQEAQKANDDPTKMHNPNLEEHDNA